MAKSLKEFKEKIVEVVTKRNGALPEVEKEVPKFDPDIPEQKQRWLR